MKISNSDNDKKAMEVREIIKAIWVHLLLFFLLGCHKEGSEDFLLALTFAPPFIEELEPQIGTPRQSGERPYPATQVSIRGRNLSDPGLEIFFNRIRANILFNSGKEVLVEVPDGAVTGRVFAKKPDGSCNLDSNQGDRCSGKEFFVDCYSPYNREFGKELVIPWGESLRYEFVGVETRAFRGEIPSSVPEGVSVLEINCPGPTTVRYFSPSCLVTDLVLVQNPQVQIPEGRILQVFVTAGGSTCTFSLR